MPYYHTQYDKFANISVWLANNFDDLAHQYQQYFVAHFYSSFETKITAKNMICLSVSLSGPTLATMVSFQNDMSTVNHLFCLFLIENKTGHFKSKQRSIAFYQISNPGCFVPIFFSWQNKKSTKSKKLEFS